MVTPLLRDQEVKELLVYLKIHSVKLKNNYFFFLLESPLSSSRCDLAVILSIRASASCGSSRYSYQFATGSCEVIISDYLKQGELDIFVKVLHTKIVYNDQRNLFKLVQ